MKDIVKNFLKEYDIDIKNKNVVVAVSTGVDSMVLLDSLIKLKQEISFDIVISHVNHGKREQSIIEEQYIRDYASKHNLKIEVLKLKKEDFKEGNFQSQARNKRLEFFDFCMKKYDSSCLFLAHHLNDDIETAIMHQLRGGSLKSFSGMMPVTKTNNNKYLFRPFLKVLKKDILEHASNNKIKYFNDYTNDSDVYTRNKIRHHVVPTLFENIPSFSDKFLEYKTTVFRSSQIIDSLRDEYIRENVVKDEEKFSFLVSTFLKQESYIQEEVLFYLLRKQELGKVNILEIIKYIKSEKNNLQINYKNICFIKEYETVTIFFHEIHNEKISIIIDNIGRYDVNEKYYLEVKKFDFNDYKKNENMLTNLNVVWYNSRMFPFTLRSRENGDKILLNFGTKKVKDLLIDEKVGILKRSELLVLAKDDNILSIFGVRKSSILKIENDNDIMIQLKEKI